MKTKNTPVDHPPIHKLEYNYITDGIFIGTNQCCQTHFDEALKTKQGITAVISLEEYRVDAPFGVDFYLWMPVKNHTPPKMEQLNFGVSVLEKLVAMDKKIMFIVKMDTAERLRLWRHT